MRELWRDDAGTGMVLPCSSCVAMRGEFPERPMISLTPLQDFWRATKTPPRRLVSQRRPLMIIGHGPIFVSYRARVLAVCRCPTTLS